MSRQFEKIIDKLIRLDQLIRMRATGTPRDLARRLDVSESTLYQYLALMKRILKAPIKYDKTTKSYFYETVGYLNVGFGLSKAAARPPELPDSNRGRAAINAAEIELRRKTKN